MKSRIKLKQVWVGLVLLCGLVSLQLFPLPSAMAAPAPARVFEIEIADAIQPITADYVNRAFDEATAASAALILIRMDTPGGLDSSMREIIQRIINSPIPVAVFIGPSGSRGASAGFYILQAADIAAMAPGTHAGAASPVLINLITRTVVPQDDTMKKKIINDATAYMRSIVSKRGRSVADAESTITEAHAYTAEESLKRNMIDLLADSPEALVKALDGREISRFDGHKQTLALTGAAITKVEMTSAENFRAAILSPDVFFILLIVGVLGIYVEFTHPGLILPGVAGGICLLLAIFAMNILPVNAMGFLLIGAAIALFILEAKYTSYGLLGLTGAVAMFVGAMILIKSPWTGAGVSAQVALGATVPFALISIFLMQLVIRTQRLKPATGMEQMLGTVGEVTEAIAPEVPGQVALLGEIWRAVSAQAIEKGSMVMVVRVDGLTVHVQTVAKSQLESSAKSVSSRD